MKISDLTADIDESLVWARRGMGIGKKYRCKHGPRKGRVVASPDQCFAARDVGKSIALGKTKKSKGKRMSRKTRRTKRYNPISRRIRKLNK